MSSECIFEFDHPNKIYFSGQTIKGRVKLQTTKPKQVKSAYILFEGHSIASFNKKILTPSGFCYEVYRSDQTLVKERINIFTEGRLPPGLHTYNFSIPLPLSCLTSCTEKYGEIIYVMSLKIDRELRYNNVFSQPITVIKPLDLNMNPEYWIPVERESVKYNFQLPCSSGPILSTLTIPYGGWAPGQNVPYTLKIKNDSRLADIQGLKFDLEQHYEFIIAEPVKQTKTQTNSLAKLPTENRVVLYRGNREFHGQIRIPPVPPTLDGGNIHISYSLGVEVDFGRLHFKSKVSVPITIGTIPLVQSILDKSATSDTPPSYDLCTPATFEEPTHIGEKFKDDKRDQFNTFVNWLPKYPMYKKITDDLSSQISWSPNMNVQHTNLFTSDVVEAATAPKVDENDIEFLKSKRYSFYNSNPSTLDAQCPPYDEESFYASDMSSCNYEGTEINTLPDYQEVNETNEITENEKSDEVTKQSDNNQND